ncbi:hypothetical protein [Halococcoides cellulosivorans]|uniref:Uncharacterized protein n=1 Tax=Halococcoides cellulosivorans TaxID=1679096 RepID=A0A2R4X3U1_9EURY|nr:hypothetical protein [Halococcoides cellulosivorans]AWB28464.1 hypothetical protein HARCEL1_12510 [Halococcoides cellulosivorans]
MSTSTERRQFTVEPRDGIQPTTLAEQFDGIGDATVRVRDGVVLISGPDYEWYEQGHDDLIAAIEPTQQIDRACWVEYNDTTMDATLEYFERIDGELTHVETYTAHGHARAYDYVCREYGFDIDEH